ncbi:response regulator [Mesorhizobium sp. M1216]|uniref:response regulator n=1 Tax=Mesorhizobium sp. M1216 TaxID=2957069 RepID=UPI003336DBE5
MADQVLIVDDDRAPVRMLGTYLTSNGGFRVQAAETAVAGIAEIARLSPDAVVLCAMLPEMDGFEALGRIRANSDVPVLMLTGEAARPTTSWGWK